jgi:DNA polymerase I-like protein with 3'-5' exonuclease and polymerase domains
VGIPPLVVDIETNGFLENATKIWCIVAKELGRGRYHWYSDHTSKQFKNSYSYYNIEDYLAFLESSEYLIFHNGIAFDVPLVQRFYPNFKPKKVEDTIILSRLFSPDRKGGHSLKQYGIEAGMDKVEHEDWTHFSIEMLERCFRDVEITEWVWNHLSVERNSWNWEDAIRLEYTVARLCAEMQLHGVVLDRELALETLRRIEEELEVIDKQLLEMIPEQVVGIHKNTPVTRIWKKNGEYTKQVTNYMEESK